MAQSKAKGNAFERDFAEQMSSIFGREFKRNISGSGAHFGGGNFYRKKKGGDSSQVLNNLGDIVPPTGYYVVSECKNYADFPFHAMLLGKETILWDWLEEVRHDARMDQGSEDVFFPHWLSFKVTRKGTYICLPSKFFESSLLNDLRSKNISFYVHNHFKNVENILTFIDSYIILDLNNLVQVKDAVLSVITDKQYFLETMEQA